jgi:hypothetical protein
MPPFCPESGHCTLLDFAFVPIPVIEPRRSCRFLGVAVQMRMTTPSSQRSGSRCVLSWPEATA